LPTYATLLSMLSARRFADEVEGSERQLLGTRKSSRLGTQPKLELTAVDDRENLRAHPT